MAFIRSLFPQRPTPRDESSTSSYHPDVSKIARDHAQERWATVEKQQLDDRLQSAENGLVALQDAQLRLLEVRADMVRRENRPNQRGT